jgi:SP family general alpha glucoside:H+ symporter-like MFS transporter
MSSEISPARPNEKNAIEHVDDLKTDATFRADAMEAETNERNMTVTEAAKAYPMACFWAFVMSSTIIVSSPPG